MTGRCCQMAANQSDQMMSSLQPGPSREMKPETAPAMPNFGYATMCDASGGCCAWHVPTSPKSRHLPRAQQIRSAARRSQQCCPELPLANLRVAHSLQRAWVRTQQGACIPAQPPSPTRYCQHTASTSSETQPHEVVMILTAHHVFLPDGPAAAGATVLREVLAPAPGAGAATRACSHLLRLRHSSTQAMPTDAASSATWVAFPRGKAPSGAREAVTRMMTKLADPDTSCQPGASWVSMGCTKYTINAGMSRFLNQAPGTLKWPTEPDAGMRSMISAHSSALAVQMASWWRA